MATRHVEPLLRINSFEVLIGERKLGFAEISRLSSEDDPALPAQARPPVRPPVVLRRALTTSSELYDWRRAIVAGIDDRRDVTIRQLAEPGGKVVNAWQLLQAWPIRWSGPVVRRPRRRDRHRGGRARLRRPGVGRREGSCLLLTVRPSPVGPAPALSSRR